VPFEIDAFHLPGLDPRDVDRWERRGYGDDVVLRFPVLDAGVWREVLRRLGTARERALAGRPVGDIVAAVDAAAARLADNDDPLRRTAESALPAITGYSLPMIRLTLDRMAADWRAPVLDRLLTCELGDPRVLDAFTAMPVPRSTVTRRVRALGPDLAFHIFAGNVPGVAVTAVVRALLVKAAVAGKLASGEPLLTVLFARALASVDSELGDCLALTYWPGGHEPLETVAFDAADAVIVYGGEEVVAAVRARTRTEQRLVVYGPRLSCGVIGADALTRGNGPALAYEVARAVAIFDQQGCVSPHVVYVERGGEISPAELARALAEAMAGIQETLPRGRISAAEAAAIHDARATAEFRALSGEPVELFASRDTAFTVIYEENAPFTVSCLNRVVRVVPVDAVDDVERELRPVARYLQTVGVAGVSGARLTSLAERLARAGASRITTFENVPWPPAEWHHDGGEPLRSLLRWVDLEYGD